MARLIDAEKLNFHCNYNGDCSGDVSHCKECDNYVLDYRDIQEQPTAYDVDKVVEQLTTARDGYSTAQLMTTADAELVKRFIAKEKAMNLAIEIVKAGGIDGR